jgi:hypothetical protein
MAIFNISKKSREATPSLLYITPRLNLISLKRMLKLDLSLSYSCKNMIFMK